MISDNWLTSGFLSVASSTGSLLTHSAKYDRKLA